MILVEYRKNIVVNAYGRRFMVIPEPLKNAYREGSVIEDIGGVKTSITYTGHNRYALYFTVEPIVKDLSGRLENIILAKLKRIVGSNGAVIKANPITL